MRKLRIWVGLALLMGTCTLLLGATDAETRRLEAAKLNNLGVALINQQLMEKALEKFDAALQADPAFTVAELNKGIALLNLQKLPEARKTLEQAAKEDPSNPRVWFNLGLLNRSEGQFQAGIEAFQHVTKLDDQDPDTHYFLGVLNSELQKYDDAIAQFQQALKLNPLHASAEFNLARALQRAGRTEEYRQHLDRFRYLTKEKIAAPMSPAYGEQGRYSIAEDSHLVTSKPGEMIPVRFTQQSLPGAKAATVPKVGGGLCVLDVDGDGAPDLIALGSGPNAIKVCRNNGKGGFVPVVASKFGLVAAGTGIACATGDYDNDDKTDLAVSLSGSVVLFRNLGNGKFEDVTKKAGISAVNKPAGLTFIDFDHDGDLDLFVTGSTPGTAAGASHSPNVLWRNNGNGTFTDWTEQTGLGGAGATSGVILSDLNNDRAVDLVTTGSEKAPTFYPNPREGKYPALPLWQGKELSPTQGIAIFDFDKDGWMDVAVTHDGAPGVGLWRNVDGKSFQRVPLPITDAKRGWGIASLDFDNDGWIDLAVVVEREHGPEVRVLRNLGPDGFADVTATLGLEQAKLGAARSLVVADVDRDGDSDLVVSRLGEPPVVLRNDGGNKNHSLRIALRGLADNKSAFGAKVEVFSDGAWQKWEVAGASGYLGQGAPEILAGVGAEEKADIVRLRWPTGVLQDEIDIAATRKEPITELDRRGSSCPVLFAWDGEKYGFITDTIGAAVVGHWISPEQKNKPDPDEWIKIEGRQLKPKDGKLSLKFGEPMEEVNYIDQLRLVAVDHKIGTEVFPNERFLSEPPFPETRTIVASQLHLPAAARDSNGRDVLSILGKRDHQYVVDFKSLPFAGFANKHSLTLDLGSWNPKNPLRLFLTGYIEYFSASSLYSAWQAGLEPMPPAVDAQLPDGSWKRVVNDMGFPAGLPRTIVADLTGKLPAGTRKIRLTSNLQIYWDQILIGNAPEPKDAVRETEIPLAHADMRFLGYPRQVSGKTPGDLTYYYNQVSMTGPFARQRGSYTHYGDVTPLLKNVDDEFVVFGTGEWIGADFDDSALPPVPEGWTRDYFFYANGFVKDMDFYEATPFTVAEMPFHGMTAYPYPAREHYPDDAAKALYELNWNDRFESGDGPQKYRFEYRQK